MRNFNRTTMNISMRIASIALTLAALSVCMVSELLARYTTFASGKDSARVAKFDISANFAGSTTNFILSSDEETGSAEYLFSVTNAGEVAVSYDLVLIFPNAVPEGVSFSINNTPPTANGLVYTFSNVDTLGVNGETKNYILKITVTHFGEEKMLTGIQVKIIASQID